MKRSALIIIALLVGGALLVRAADVTLRIQVPASPGSPQEQGKNNMSMVAKIKASALKPGPAALAKNLGLIDRDGAVTMSFEGAGQAYLPLGNTLNKDQVAALKKAAESSSEPRTAFLQSIKALGEFEIVGGKVALREPLVLIGDIDCLVPVDGSLANLRKIDTGVYRLAKDLAKTSAMPSKASVHVSLETGKMDLLSLQVTDGGKLRILSKSELELYFDGQQTVAPNPQPSSRSGSQLPKPQKQDSTKAQELALTRAKLEQRRREEYSNFQPSSRSGSQLPGPQKQDSTKVQEVDLTRAKLEQRKREEHILAADESTLDVLEACLVVSQGCFPKLDVREQLAAVDAMADSVRSRLPKNADVVRSIREINKCLYEENGFKPDESVCLVGDALVKKKGACVPLSILYWSIATRLGLNAKIISLPEHYFVRIEDKGKVFNVETTAQGAIKSETDIIPRKISRQRVSKAQRSWLPATPRQIVAETVNWRGVYYGKIGQQNRAIQDHRTALHLDPKNPCILNNLGGQLLLVNDKDTTNAIAYCEQAVAVDPLFGEPYNTIGACFLMEDKYDKAQEAFTSAIQCNPKYVNAIKNRSGVYYLQDNYDATITDASEALRLDPNCSDAYFNRGRAFSAKGETIKAIADLSKAVELSPADAEVYFARAKCYAKANMRQAALQDAKKASSLSNRIVAKMKEDPDLGPLLQPPEF